MRRLICEVSFKGTITTQGCKRQLQVKCVGYGFNPGVASLERWIRFQEADHGTLSTGISDMMRFSHTSQEADVLPVDVSKVARVYSTGSTSVSVRNGQVALEHHHLSPPSTGSRYLDSVPRPYQARRLGERQVMNDECESKQRRVMCGEVESLHPCRV